MSKNDWKHLRDVDMEKDGTCKMEKVKKIVVLERAGEGRLMLELIKKGKKNWLGHWLRRNFLLKDALERMVNGITFRGRTRYYIVYNIMINGLYADTKRKAEIG